MSATRASILGVAQTPRQFRRCRSGACDCHTHIFGPDEKFPLSPKRLYTPGPASIEDLNALHKAIHIDRVVVVHPSPYGADNAVTVDAVRKMGAPRARRRGDRRQDDRCRARRHARSRHPRRARQHRNLWRERSRRRRSSFCNTRPSASRGSAGTCRPIPISAFWRRWHDVICKLPTPLVVDHFGRPKAEQGIGQPGFAELLALLRSGKVYVKISAPYRISQVPDYADAAPIARAMIAANPDRVVWGTDWPHPGAAKRDPAVIEPFRPEDNGAALNRLGAVDQRQRSCRRFSSTTRRGSISFRQKKAGRQSCGRNSQRRA